MKKTRFFMSCFALAAALLLIGIVLYGNTLEKTTPKQIQSVYEIERCSITEVDNLYRCDFYGKDHNILRTEVSPKYPHIEELPNGVIKYTTQAGTGIGTQWGFFFDSNNEVFSEVFEGIFDQKDDLVLLLSKNGVTIRTIFDDSFCKEINHFSNELSPAAVPIDDASFSETSGTIVVSYFTGDDFNIITESIPY